MLSIILDFLGLFSTFNTSGLKPLSPEVLKTQLEEGWELGDLYRVGDPTVGGWPW
jgi:hypothetical protein